MSKSELNAAVDREIARRAFVNEHLADVPDAYHVHVNSDDPAQWESQAKAAREKAQKDRADWIAANPPPPPPEPGFLKFLSPAMQKVAKDLKVAGDGSTSGDQRAAAGKQTVALQPGAFMSPALATFAAGIVIPKD